MTRLLWTLIALFPLPLVALLLAEPPELFERERVQAAYTLATELEGADIDWPAHFATSKRIVLKEVLPDSYRPFDLALERRGQSDQLVLIAPMVSEEDLRYRLADACWVLPPAQFSLLRRCRS